MYRGCVLIWSGRAGAADRFRAVKAIKRQAGRIENAAGDKSGDKIVHLEKVFVSPFDFSKKSIIFSCREVYFGEKCCKMNKKSGTPGHKDLTKRKTMEISEELKKR